MTDANGNVTKYTYDRNDRKTREDRPSVAGTTAVRRVQYYFYDAADRLVREVTKSATGGEDRAINYQYDPLDRLIRKIVQREGASNVVEDDSSFSYEDQVDATLLKTAVNGVATLGFSNGTSPPFASSGFSVAASQSGNPLELIEGDFAIMRDVNGEIASVSKDGNSIYAKQYDAAGRMLSGTMGSGSTAITWDGFGRKASVLHSDGSSGSFQHDLLDRLTHSTWSTPSGTISEALTYDLAGNITNIARENGAYTVAYDAIDQILSSTGLENRSWTLDALGNRLQDSTNGAGSFTNNFLTSNGVASYLADPDGFGDTVREVKNGVTKNYVYRADGRISGFQSGSTQVAYYYDGLGRLNSKAINDGVSSYTQSFLYIGQDRDLLQAKAGDGTTTTYLNDGPDNHLAELKNGVYKGYVIDHLGSVLNSEMAGSGHRFSIFGDSTGPAPLNISSDPASFGFAGGMHNRESNMTKFDWRDLNHDNGRWLSQDPIGFDGGDENLYRYVLNGPLRHTDPTGLKPSIPGSYFDNVRDACKEIYDWWKKPTPPPTNPPPSDEKTVEICNNAVKSKNNCAVDFPNDPKKRQDCMESWQRTIDQCKSTLPHNTKKPETRPNS